MPPRRQSLQIWQLHSCQKRFTQTMLKLLLHFLLIFEFCFIIMWNDVKCFQCADAPTYFIRCFAWFVVSLFTLSLPLYSVCELENWEINLITITTSLLLRTVCVCVFLPVNMYVYVCDSDSTTQTISTGWLCSRIINFVKYIERKEKNVSKFPSCCLTSC